MHRLIPALILLSACAPTRVPPAVAPTPGPETSSVGVLVMAHGGSEAWNRTVANAVAPLSREIPLVVAYGMADPVTLEAGLDSLRSLGVERVAVVRMFVSGQSFLEQTEYFLGLRSDRPSDLFLMGNDPTTAKPIDHDLDLATHEDGLMVSVEAGRILMDRAAEASRDRARESVLLLAHGMGGEAQNGRVLEAMREVADQLEVAGFANARAETLREDWAEQRAIAEASIREFVADETADGRRVIVLPMRLSGFGPYADVLAGLDYTAAEGLLPHAQVTKWIRAKACQLISAEGWQGADLQCHSVVPLPLDEGR